MKNKKDQIIDGVMSQIKSGKVRMKPAVYFSILSTASIVASLIAGVAISYLSSVIFFWFKILTTSGNAYGARANLGRLIGSFLWWAVLIFLALVGLIVYIIRRFGGMYRFKVLHIVLIIVAISILIAFILSSFGVGDIHDYQNNQRNQFHGSWLGK